MVEASAKEALGGDLGGEASHKVAEQEKPEEPNANSGERKAPGLVIVKTGDAN